MNWTWQMQNRVRTVEDLARTIGTIPHEPPPKTAKALTQGVKKASRAD